MVAPESAPARKSLTWPPATGTFLLGYAIATALGIALYATGSRWMWLGAFAVMLLVFAALAYRYLQIARPNRAARAPAAAILAPYWVALSFLLNAALYLVVISVAFGARPDWAFFIERSQWIWISYASLFAMVFVCLAAYPVAHVPAR